MKNTLAIFLIVILSVSGYAQDVDIRKKHFNIKKNVAIGGYDPVSYFFNGPKKGLKENEYTYKGVIYHFENRQNLDKFKATPEKYEPQYGGWCAYAIGETGDKVKIDPHTFQILDDKLYLFYNFAGLNTLDNWKEDQSKLKTAADENWGRITHQ